MKILVACEYSGVVRDAFIRHGHDAVSCDLLPSESDFGPHIQGDVRPLLKQEWDMVIAHPPCNYLTMFTWAFGNQKRQGDVWWEKYEEGAELFQACLDANAPMVAVENPSLMHPPARNRFGKPDDVTNFRDFGSPFQKKVGWWLKGLPPLWRTLFNPEAESLVGYRPSKGNPDKRFHNGKAAGIHTSQHERNRFQPEIAEAMAIQWGNYNA